MSVWSTKDFDALVANAFMVEIGGQAMSVKEVTGLKKEFDMIEVKTQTMKGSYVVKKIPGREKAVSITITRPLTENPYFDEWMDLTKDGVVDRRNVVVKILPPGKDTAKSIKTYIVHNCQPSAVEITQVTAGATNALDEKITLQGEYIEVKKG